MLHDEILYHATVYSAHNHGHDVIDDPISRGEGYEDKRQATAIVHI